MISDKPKPTTGHQGHLAFPLPQGHLEDAGVWNERREPRGNRKWPRAAAIAAGNSAAEEDRGLWEATDRGMIYLV